MSHNKQRWQLGHSVTVSDVKGSIDDLSVWYQSINYTYRIAIIGVAVCVFCANAMCSKTTVRHFDVQSLTWPSKSPDLNAIEHMWDSLENRIRNCPVQPHTRQNKMHCIKSGGTSHNTRFNASYHQWGNVAEHASPPGKAIRDIEL